MKHHDKLESKQLLTLERWRSMELENAQADYVKLAQATVEKRSVVDRVQSDIADSQSFARSQMLSEQALSPESLRRCAEFAALQTSELTAAQLALQESRTHSQAAHAEVVGRFGRLSVVERLRERRAVEAAKAARRLAQKRLDEQALSRLAGGSHGQLTRTGEE